MRNIRLTIEYNGANFYGWQKQKDKRTVQGEIEKAIFSLTGVEVCLEGSGRTDKGVHALAQVANFLVESKIPTSNFKGALNNLLPSDVRIKKVEEVSMEFHSRFSAKKKTYKYVVQVGGEPSAVACNHLAFYPYSVTFEKILNASKMLIGRHNFKGFCSADTSVTNFERTIYDITVKKQGRKFVFEISGNGFLYNMVRIIVGTLLDVGRGSLDESDVEKALTEHDRNFSGVTMPACGLYLKKVEYENNCKFKN